MSQAPSTLEGLRKNQVFCLMSSLPSQDWNWSIRFEHRVWNEIRQGWCSQRRTSQFPKIHKQIDLAGISQELQRLDNQIRDSLKGDRAPRQQQSVWTFRSHWLWKLGRNRPWQRCRTEVGRRLQKTLFHACLCSSGWESWTQGIRSRNARTIADSFVGAADLAVEEIEIPRVDWIGQAKFQHNSRSVR